MSTQHNCKVPLRGVNTCDHLVVGKNALHDLELVHVKHLELMVRAACKQGLWRRPRQTRNTTLTLNIGISRHETFRQLLPLALNLLLARLPSLRIDLPNLDALIDVFNLES